MNHSIAYLAGVGAAALGLSASDSPIRCTDHDAYGDFLNGLGAHVTEVGELEGAISDAEEQIADHEQTTSEAEEALRDALDLDHKAAPNLSALVAEAVKRLEAADKPRTQPALALVKG